jgi:hypothetical protein
LPLPLPFSVLSVARPFAVNNGDNAFALPEERTVWMTRPVELCEIWSMLCINQESITVYIASEYDISCDHALTDRAVWSRMY